MTGPTARHDAEREALAEALCLPIKRLSGPNMSAMCGGGCKDVADVVLASGWLAAHDAAVAAQARREAAERVLALCDDVGEPNGVDIHVPGFVPVSDLRRAIAALISDARPGDAVAAVLERVRAALNEGDIQRQTGVQVGMRVLAALDAVDQYLYGDGGDERAAAPPRPDTQQGDGGG